MSASLAAGAIRLQNLDVTKSPSSSYSVFSPLPRRCRSPRLTSLPQLSSLTFAATALLFSNPQHAALLTFTNAPDLYTASARFVVAFPLEYSPKVYQSVDRQ